MQHAVTLDLGVDDADRASATDLLADAIADLTERHPKIRVLRLGGVTAGPPPAP